MSKILKKIEQKSGIPKLADTLSQKLNVSDLNSLLLEVFSKHAESISPAQLMTGYNSNRFVKPSLLDPVEFNTFEIKILKAAAKHKFKAVQLSPVAPLGSCSALAPLKQDIILSALRGCEVVGDATNLLALQIAAERKDQSSRSFLQKYCCAHRHLRTQPFDNPAWTAHFAIFCMASAGRDTGCLHFEKESLMEHVSFYTYVMQKIARIKEFEIELIRFPGYDHYPKLADDLYDYLRKNLIEEKIIFDPQHKEDNNYYSGIRFKLNTFYKGEKINIADGGLVDWGQKLLQDKKERMFTSGLGTELLFKLLKKMI